MKKLSLILFLALIIVAGCRKDRETDIFTEPEEKTFTAFFESSGTDSKVALDSDGKLCWTADDVISVFEGTTHNTQYVFNGNTGDRSGSFTRQGSFTTGEDIGTNIAVYPYSASVSVSTSGIISTSIPSTMNYTPNSFGNNTNLMVAVTSGLSDYSLHFKNVCGYLKIQLTGTVSVKSISLRGNNNEKLSGAASITATYDGQPAIQMSSSASSSVTISCGTAGAALDRETVSNFFFVVPPQVFSKGITIVITDTQGRTMTKSSSSSIEVKRNTILPMLPFICSTSGGVTPTWQTIPDRVNKWMELPVVATTSTAGYVSHHSTFASGEKRNYSILYDSNYKLALWVAYPLCSDYLGSYKRDDSWSYDPKIPSGLQPNIINGTYGIYADDQCDRGHQIPSADRVYDQASNAATFYVSNITAQHKYLNQRVWVTLETKIRSDYMASCDTVYVVTGPVVTTAEDRTVTYILDKSSKNIAKPKAYFKVLLKYEKGTNTYSSIGFWFENKEYTTALYSSYAHSVTWIEDQTGLTFFPNLPDDIEYSVKSRYNPSAWGL